MSHRVLVVEDSEPLNDLLCDALTQAGFDTHGFLDAEALLESSLLKDADVLVLDIQLPGEDGLSLARRLRPLLPGLGLLMLTARTSNLDRIKGYDAGGDYYLPKPISPGELCQAVESLCRRKSISVKDELVRSGACLLSSHSGLLRCGGESVSLSPREVDVLVALASAPDRQLEHWQLLDLLSVQDMQLTRAALDVRIHRLRAKLSVLNQTSQAIVAIRGYGYKLVVDLSIV